MEHSDRGKYVTEQVSVWICNDGKEIGPARDVAHMGPEALKIHLTEVIHTGYRYSAPWQVAQELAANDYNRIDWRSVADDLLAGDE